MQKTIRSIKKRTSTNISSWLLVAFATAAWAQAASSQPWTATPETATPETASIEVASFGDAIHFALDRSYETVWVELSGPGDFHARQRFGAGDSPAVMLEQAMMDGAYTWELLAVQAPGGQAPDAGDDRAADHSRLSRAYSGTFKILDGLVELPVQGGAERQGVGAKRQGVGAERQGVGAERQGVGAERQGVGAERQEKDLQKSTTIPDNLIVTGSTCSGFDCVSGESFGFDILRLKQNALRIHFDDTSSSPYFPQNDWRLVANDLGPHGADYFAIEDATGGRVPFRVEAGAHDHALYVQADGDVGLGTSTPAVDLHVSGSNTPTLRLEQDGSGFAAQIWDVGGNEYIFSISEGPLGPSPLVIEAGSETGALRITDEGLIGLHNSSPRAPLHVLAGGVTHTPSNASTVAIFQNNGEENDGSIVSILAGNGSANAQLWFGDVDDDKAGRVIYRNGSDSLSFWTAGGERLLIEDDGDICFGCSQTGDYAILHANGAALTTGGVWTTTSSRALKQDVAKLSSQAALEALAGLEPVTFRYRAEQNETYVGFIAEDVPELVAMNDRRSLTSMDVVAVLTKVIQAQQQRLERQEAAITELRHQVNDPG